MSLVDVPREWRQFIRQSTQHLPSRNSEVALSKVMSKLLYNAQFKSKKQDPPTAQKCLRRNFHSFRVSGRKYSPCLLQSRLKLKLENSNIKCNEII